MIYSTKHLNEAKYIQIADRYYAERTEWLALSKEAQHCDLCTCVAKRRKKLILTGQSACAAFGVPRLDFFETRPHGTSEIFRETDDIVRWHFGPCDPDVAVINGLLVASPIRTICDLAKCDSPESLLVSINHCLFHELFSKERLTAELEKRTRMKGKALLKQVLRYTTPKCESPLETIAWIALYNAGFTMPQQQVVIHDNGSFVARVDMYWELRGRKVVLELDGRIKYEIKDNLIEEKRREDKLRDMGYEVIRADWGMVKKGELVQKLMKKEIPMRRYSARKFPCRNP
jgi:very-short-patch-repair endonuclease